MRKLFERFLMRFAKQDDCCMVDHEATEVTDHIAQGVTYNGTDPLMAYAPDGYKELEGPSLEDEIYEYADHLAEDTAELYDLDTQKCPAKSPSGYYVCNLTFGHTGKHESVNIGEFE